MMNETESVWADWPTQGGNDVNFASIFAPKAGQAEGVESHPGLGA